MLYKVKDIYNREKTFSLSYKELKEKYLYFDSLDEHSFFENMPQILHLICIIAFLKEIPSYLLLGDEFLIHEIVHCMDNTTDKKYRNIQKNKKIVPNNKT